MEPQTPPETQAQQAPEGRSKYKPTDTSYPASFDIRMPDHQSRLLALFSLPLFLIRIILVIPHIVVLYFLQIAAMFAAWLNVWAIVFTGHSSIGLYRFAAGSLRWSVRVNSYTYGLTDKYPPFSLNK